MTRYRKKPVVIEAVQWTGDNDREVFDHLSRSRDGGYFKAGTRDLQIRTLEGPLHAAVGDWIIRGVQNEAYPCKPDIFDATYEPAEGGAAKEEPA